MEIEGLTIYEDSVVEEDGTTCFLASSGEGEKLLGVKGDDSEFEGERRGDVLVCPLTIENGARLRARLRQSLGMHGNNMTQDEVQEMVAEERARRGPYEGFPDKQDEDKWPSWLCCHRPGALDESQWWHLVDRRVPSFNVVASHSLGHNRGQLRRGLGSQEQGVPVRLRLPLDKRFCVSYNGVSANDNANDSANQSGSGTHNRTEPS